MLAMVLFLVEFFVMFVVLPKVLPTETPEHLEASHGCDVADGGAGTVTLVCDRSPAEGNSRWRASMSFVHHRHGG